MSENDPPVARDYVITMESFGNESKDRYAMYVRAFTDEEAIRQVQRRCGSASYIFNTFLNHLATPRDVRLSLHADLRLNMLTVLAADAVV